MASTPGKINVKAFASRFEQQGVTPMKMKEEPKKLPNMSNSTEQNKSPKRVAPVIKASTGGPPQQINFGRETLNKQLDMLKAKNEEKPTKEEKKSVPKPLPRTELGAKPGKSTPALGPKPGQKISPTVGPKPGHTPPALGPKPGQSAPVLGPKPGIMAPALGPKPGITAAIPGLKPGPKQVLLTQNTDNVPLSENKTVNGDTNGDQKPAAPKLLPEGLAMKNRLTPVNRSGDKRKSYMKPKQNPIPPEGILGKAPPKPPRPPVILEVKRDLRAPLPPPPEFAFEIEEEEEYNDVDALADGRPVSLIEPMDEEEELGEFYDDVESSRPPPARRQDPLPATPILTASVSSAPDEGGEIYDDVSGAEEEGEGEDIYETFDEVTSQSLTRTGSQETLSSTSSKDRDEKELEKQRKKEEKERKKQEEKEKKERERKEKEEKKRKKEEEKKVKKLYNTFDIKGNETVALQGAALRTNTTSEDPHNLPYTKGEMLYVVRMDGNPEGKWLAKNEAGKYGYVEMGDIEADNDETYDEAESGLVPEGLIEEETYECLDNI